ncbi:SDR family oxidoreductase [Shewanella dokdonensis]|uniref:SDR family oxidoreductase n=1 Tax=Shewanella dokdonensis TaxID=712036 RepID=A0ABX8DDE5_9GAMM|nr:SDR family oxidoreductase [Shewanella dokdonensis]MCL1073490.1 SDR family oxidoreductase [Shewanella dokdonensis]QVK22721.1 SDR family oxidoreductase [Shewanella dokdonensis]
MLAVTGATGQLGRLVIEALLKKVPAQQIVAAVRNPDKAKDLAAKGIQVRLADYNHPNTLVSAFANVDKLLLISSSEIGKRTEQHKAVIDAAKAAGVSLLAYTSLLHTDTSPLMLAEEHSATEAYIKQSGIPAVILRNGWYSENYTGSVAAALSHGAVFGCAKDGKLATASRADYAAAAAAVLTQPDQAGKVYELAGDNAFTLTQYAAYISAASGKKVEYKNLSQAEYIKLLEQVGLPAAVASMLGDSEAGAAQGALFDNSKQLSALIGRPTTPIAQSIKAVL